MTHRPAIGTRIQIPVHYDLWARGARYGTVTAHRNGSPGKSACVLVRMDHPQVKRRARIWATDWEYCRIVE